MDEGGANEDRAFGIATDSPGNVFVTGFFKSTATLGSFTFNNFSTVKDEMPNKLQVEPGNTKEDLAPIISAL